MTFAAPITRAALALVLSFQAVAPAFAQEGTSAQSAVEADTNTIAAPEILPLAGQDPFYCGERKLGTWFYCESPKPKTPAKQPEASAPPAKAMDRLALITKALDELRAKAILEPTTENVAAYIRYQREQLDRASTFADVWQRAIWQDPSLDYTLQRPVNTLGKNAWLEQRKSDQAATMAALSRRYGLFFFFSSSCGACEAFSPVLKGLSEQYNLSVLPVSMDGGPIASFRNYVVDHGQYQRMGLQGGQVPALVLFDTLTKKPIPVGYGVMAADEVMQRIFTLTSVKVGSDY